MVAEGSGFIVMVVAAVKAAHPFPAGIVYLIVCVPVELVPRLIAPVVLFICNPGVPLYAPPAVPVCVTEITPPLEQKVVPLYEMVAVGAAVIVTELFAVTAAQPPVAGDV